MATFVQTAATIWCNQYDLTSDVNEIAPSWECEVKDATNYGSGGVVERKAGLSKTDVDVKTFYNTATGQVEPVVNSLRGAAQSILSLTPTGADLDRAVFVRGIVSNAKHLGKVGDMAPLDLTVSSDSLPGLVEGRLLLPKTTLGAGTAAGSGYQEGAVSSSRIAYAALHVFAVTGSSPTLDLVIQSDDNSGFTTATNRITLASGMAAAGSAWGSVAGAITDDYWRIAYTVGGSSTPTFSAAVVFGIV